MLIKLKKILSGKYPGVLEIPMPPPFPTPLPKRQSCPKAQAKGTQST